MSLVEDFPALWKEISPTLAQLATEAKLLRDAPRPDEADTVTHIRDRAVEIRRRLDRLEQITADIGRLRSRAEAYVAQCQDAYDDKVSETIRSTKVAEYTTAAERNAVNTAKAFNELLALRQAKKQLRDVAEVHEFCKTLHRGLDSARRDEQLLFNLITFESRLES